MTAPKSLHDALDNLVREMAEKNALNGAVEITFESGEVCTLRLKLPE